LNGLFGQANIENRTPLLCTAETDRTLSPSQQKQTEHGSLMFIFPAEGKKASTARLLIYYSSLYEFPLKDQKGICSHRCFDQIPGLQSVIFEFLAFFIFDQFPVVCPTISFWHILSTRFQKKTERLLHFLGRRGNPAETLLCHSGCIVHSAGINQKGAHRIKP